MVFKVTSVRGDIYAAKIIILSQQEPYSISLLENEIKIMT